MKKKSVIWLFSITLMGLFLIFNSSCNKDDNNDDDNNDFGQLKVTDYDGNVYNTVAIGNQTWMAENLKVAHYRNGDPIPNITDYDDWETLSTGAYCTYFNLGTYGSIYGKLYNYYAVSDERNLSPDGWHIPTLDDWNILINFIGGESVAGGKLKETDTTHWENPNNGATNEYGFTALPGGFRTVGDNWCGINLAGAWWIGGINSSDYRVVFIYGLESLVEINEHDYKSGFSVRCIKD